MYILYLFIASYLHFKKKKKIKKTYNVFFVKLTIINKYTNKKKHNHIEINIDV